MTKTKKIKICEVCRRKEDGVSIGQDSMVEYMKDERNFFIYICKECKKGLKSGISVYCYGCVKNGSDLPGLMVFDAEKLTDKVKTLLMSLTKDGKVFVSGCPKCTENKRYNFTAPDPEILKFAEVVEKIHN